MKIDHIAIYVDDLESAKLFFERYFAATSGKIYINEKRGFKSYFLSFDDGASRIEIMTLKELNDRKTTPFDKGLVHFAISVGSKTAVDNLTHKLQTDGYEIIGHPRTTGDGYYESCIAGVEGIIIEITE